MAPESTGTPSCPAPSPGGMAGEHGAAVVAVTPAMVRDAAAVLRESGLIEQYPGKPAELVVEAMLKAALRRTRA